MRSLTVALTFALIIVISALAVVPGAEAAEGPGVGVDAVWPLIKDFHLVPVQDDFNFIHLNLTHVNGQNYIWRVYVLLIDSDGAISANFTFERMEARVATSPATNTFLEGAPVKNKLIGSTVDYWEDGNSNEQLINLGLMFRFEPVEASTVDITVVDINLLEAHVNAPFPTEAGSAPPIPSSIAWVIIPFLALIIAAGAGVLRYGSNTAAKLAEQRISK